MSRTLLTVPIIALSGCQLFGSRDTTKTTFDFGPPPIHQWYSAPGALPADLVVADIVAPGWMDRSPMYYRLTYRDAANPVPYAHSQWVMSPAALLTQRLRWTLSTGNDGDSTRTSSSRETYLLRGELMEMDQIFDQPAHSRGVLRFRATLEAQKGAIQAQRSFEIEEDAPTPDAPGGVKALSLCALELSDSVTEWVADEVRTAPR